MADSDPQLGGVISGDWFMKAISEAILKKLSETDVLISPALAVISNQVEIDAFRAEARLEWEARRARMTQEERELEDLTIELEDLNRGINVTREADSG